MSAIAFTGTRNLLDSQIDFLFFNLADFLSYDLWIVGDCRGVDAAIADYAEQHGKAIEIHHCEGGQRWQFADRSRRMIDASRARGCDRLIAFPGARCPVGLTLQSWQGAGTWGTARYALSLGMAVDVRSLVSVPYPAWLAGDRQIALF